MSVKIAAAYIRVSTDDQIEYSPESQLKVIRDYAKRNDFIIPDEYVFMDEGISGRKAEKRPAFMQMIGLAKTKPKPFDAILLWKFSRFARNREDSIVYKSMLRKQLGIEVLSVSESLGDDKMSILIEALIEAMDEYYSINLAEEVRRGMTEKARRGEPLSIAPFGYVMKDKKLIVNPDEAAIIRKAFEMYDEGRGFVGIAKHLNSLGVRTHRGGKIENRTVEYWLNNPAYIGKIRWTPTGRMRRDYNNPDSMIVDGSHEPLVDMEIWNRVQERMRATKEQYRKWMRPRDGISHWLVGMVYCGVCGGISVNCSGYYMCNNHNKGTCPGAGGIKTTRIADYVDNALKNFQNGISEGIDIEYTTQTASTDTTAYEALLASAKGRMQRVREAYEAGIDTLDEYRVNKEKITAEIEEIEQHLKAEEPVAHEEKYEELLKKISSALIVIEDPNTSAEEKNSLLRTFVSKIVKTKDEITIKFYA